MSQQSSRSQLQSRSHMRLSTLNSQYQDVNFQYQDDRRLSQSSVLQQQKSQISDQLDLEFEYKYKKLICKISQTCKLGDLIQRILSEFQINEDVEFLQSQKNLTQYQKSLTLKDLKISDNQLIKILPKFQEGKILAKFHVKEELNNKFKLKIEIVGQNQFQMNIIFSSALEELVKILSENFPKYLFSVNQDILEIKKGFLYVYRLRMKFQIQKEHSKSLISKIMRFQRQDPFQKYELIKLRITILDGTREKVLNFTPHKGETLSELQQKIIEILKLNNVHLDIYQNNNLLTSIGGYKNKLELSVKIRY